MRAVLASVRNRTETPAVCWHPVWMTGPVHIQPKRNRPGAAERGNYMIDGFRVSFLHQAEWNCACREFSVAGACRHTREAEGMRDAQAHIRRRMRRRLGQLL